MAEWWEQLGEYVERRIGAVTFTSSTITGDLPQVLVIESAASRTVFVTQGAAQGKHPREFVAVTDESDDEFRTGLTTALRELAYQSLNSEAAFRPGDTIAFEDPPQALWPTTRYSGFCITGGALENGDEGDLKVSGIGHVPLLSAVPVYTDEMLGNARRTLRAELVRAGSLAHRERPSLAGQVSS